MATTTTNTTNTTNSTNESSIENPEPVYVDPAEIPMSKKNLDKGFKRNMVIILVALLLAVGVIAVVIFGARSKITANQTTIPPTSISGTNSSGGTNSSDLTTAEADRLARVQTKESDTAQINKETYIPKDLPLSPALNAPLTSNNGPGVLGQRNYEDGQSQGSPNDLMREANIKKGVEIQLAALLAKFEPPGTSTAGPYASPLGTNSSNSNAGNAGYPSNGFGNASAYVAAPEILIRGLKFASARLVSPLDTSRTDFISAEITSGPLVGAYLIGKGKLVNDTGVMLEFTRMSFNNDDYVVDVKALDNSTSSDSVSADIDKKILSRTILPVLFSTAQAYLNAVAQPASTVVAGGLSNIVVTPALAGRQAVATGLAVGVGKAGEGLSTQKPSAFMPVSSPINLLFNSAVFKKASK